MEKPEFQLVADGVVMSGGVQHRVTEARSWINQHGALFTDWRAGCGKEGTSSGAGETAPTGLLNSGRYHRLRRGACKVCTARGLLW